MHFKNYLDHVYAVSDDNGNLDEHYRYSAFGEVEIYSPTGQKLTESAIDNTVMWNSRRFDKATELYYYKYRHYKADIGRWLGRDPIEERGGINVYGFCYNLPLNYWDAYGLGLWGWWSGVVNGVADDVGVTAVADAVRETGGNAITATVDYIEEIPEATEQLIDIIIDEGLDTAADILESVDVEAGLGGNASTGGAIMGPLGLGGELSVAITLTTKCRVCVTVSGTWFPGGGAFGGYTGTGLSVAIDFNNSYEGTNFQNSATAFGGLAFGGQGTIAGNDHSFAIDVSFGGAGGAGGAGIVAGLTYSSTGCASILRHRFDMQAALGEATGEAFGGLGNFGHALGDSWDGVFTE